MKVRGLALIDAHPDIRLTPPEFLAALVSVLGPVGLDPCSSSSGFVVADRYIDEAQDGLKNDWKTTSYVFCNPPFSQTDAWIRKAHHEFGNGNARTVVMLVKATTSSRAFQTIITRYADTILLEKPVKFLMPDGLPVAKGSPPFSLMLSIFGGPSDVVDKLRAQLPGVIIRATERLQVDLPD